MYMAYLNAKFNRDLGGYNELAFIFDVITIILLVYYIDD